MDSMIDQSNLSSPSEQGTSETMFFKKTGFEFNYLRVNHEVAMNKEFKIC